VTKKASDRYRLLPGCAEVKSEAEVNHARRNPALCPLPSDFSFLPRRSQAKAGQLVSFSAFPPSVLRPPPSVLCPPISAFSMAAPLPQALEMRTGEVCYMLARRAQSDCPEFAASRPVWKRGDALPDQPDTLPAPRPNPEGWQRVAGVSFQGRRGGNDHRFPVNDPVASRKDARTRTLEPASSSVSIRVHLWFLQPQSRGCPEAHRRGQPLQSGARNAKNAPESAICGVLLNRPATTG
jgi:hypothetical protein